MTDFCEQVDKALRAAGLRIHGVSIGRKEEKRSWRVDFADFREGDEEKMREVIESFDVEGAKEIEQASRGVVSSVVPIRGKEVSISFGKERP